mmetsp:Transcript_5191/g.5652  ORF Transcript_5191/g.5652 Transcript_5191/m.5652 type:complete len:273 (+) Transcript_5191:107-925(+)
MAYEWQPRATREKVPKMISDYEQMILKIAEGNAKLVRGPKEQIRLPGGRGGAYGSQIVYNKCKKCGRDCIGDHIESMGVFFHIECFCCGHCGKRLNIGSGKYYEDLANKIPYCVDCLPKVFNCFRCHEGIVGNYIKFSNGKMAHLNCKSLYCPKCDVIVDSRQILAMDRVWHFECFTCTSCNKSLGEGQHANVEQKPYCVPCAKQKQGITLLEGSHIGGCIVCRQNIDGGKYLQFSDKKVHLSCFNCFKCRTPLEATRFCMTPSGQLACTGC